MTDETLEQQRKNGMERLLACRAEASRIIAERDKREDWAAWAELQVKAFRHEAMLRRILGDHLPVAKPVVLI
jgi:hypothetical protein